LAAKIVDGPIRDDAATGVAPGAVGETVAEQDGTGLQDERDGWDEQDYRMNRMGFAMTHTHRHCEDLCIQRIRSKPSFRSYWILDRITG